MIAAILLVLTSLCIVDLHGISFGFKTCTSLWSATSQAVTVTIYEGNKMFQCVIPSANEKGKVYKCSDKPQGDDVTASECRSADNDRYGMLISVPPGPSGTDDVCVDKLIINGPTEYETKNGYIGDGLFGFGFRHSRYYDFGGDKPSASNPGPFPNSVVYEGAPTCFEKCEGPILPPPPPPPCTKVGPGPAQPSESDGFDYCPNNGCFLESMHCNFGALQNGNFVPNPLPCVPVCSVLPPPGGPMITAVAAHGEASVAINDNDAVNAGKYTSLMNGMNKLEDMTLYGFGFMCVVMVIMVITVICLVSRKVNKTYQKAYNADPDV